MTGYEIDELKDQNIEVLMPDFLKGKHTNILKNYVRTGKNFSKGQINTFLLNKAGYLDRVNIMLKLVLTMKGIVEFVGLVRRVKSNKFEDNHYLIVDKEGFIEGATHSFVESTGVDMKVLRALNFNMFMLCPDLREELSGKAKKTRKIAI